MTLFLLICSHFVCDYPLQSDFIAVGKNPAKSPYNGVHWFWIMCGHSFTHGAGVAIVTNAQIQRTIDTMTMAGRVSLSMNLGWKIGHHSWPT